MGRQSWSNRITVEQCISISTAWLNRYGYFDGLRSGRIEWRNASGEVISSIGIEVLAANESIEQDYLRLYYTITKNHSEENTDLDYKVFLASTRCNFGGRRFWFLCPLSVNDRPCQRRVGVLHLPPGGNYFGCRNCYNLTYKCQKEHDSRIDKLVADPGLLARISKGGNPTRSFWALKAHMKILGKLHRF
jgi:hypothetical protein